MATAQYFKSNLLGVNPSNFEEFALQLFRFQARENRVYAQYLDYLGCRPKDINHLEAIPFLPIEFFKSQSVSVYSQASAYTFTSSGTTGSQTSKHYVHDLAFYEQMSALTYEQFYGPVEEYCILALLPAYLERKGSSLIYMAQHFISKSTDPQSGFFLHDLEALATILQNRGQRKVLLLGVTFALLDLAEKFPQDLSNCLVMETGGMKGRRKEMVREEVHAVLKKAFQINQVHSEYGMTELFSQAYSKNNGRFETPPWMRVMIRQMEDPLSRERTGKTGGINVIDLANVESCAFLQTQDLGRLHADGSFSVLGRFDQSDMRGCNLMVV